MSTNDYPFSDNPGKVNQERSLGAHGRCDRSWKGIKLEDASLLSKLSFSVHTLPAPSETNNLLIHFPDPP